MKSKYPDPREIARRVVLESVGGPDGLTPSQIMSQVLLHSQSQNGKSISPDVIAALPLRAKLNMVKRWCQLHGVRPELCQAAMAYTQRIKEEMV